MLIKCPKCGFDQPKDTYCANCGIEIDSYRPQKPSLFRRIVRSPLYYLVLLIIVILAAYKGFKHLPSATKPTLSKTIDLRTVTAPTATPSPTPANPKGVIASEAKHQAKTPDQPPPPPMEPTPTPTATALAVSKRLEKPSGMAIPNAAPSPQESSTSVPKETEPSLAEIEAINGPLELEIRYLEAPTSAIQQFMAAGAEETTGDSGEMQYAIVKNSARWLRQLAFTELDHLNKKVPPVKQKLRWFSGVAEEPSTGAPYGFNFQVTLLERNGGHFSGEIFISRTTIDLSENGPMTHRKEFMTQFETRVGSLIGITGIMPRSIFKTEDKDWLQESLLKLFLSNSYQSGESDLLILMQFKGDSKK